MLVAGLSFVEGVAVEVVDLFLLLLVGVLAAGVFLAMVL